MGQHLLLIALAAPLLVLGALAVGGEAVFVAVFLFWHPLPRLRRRPNRPGTAS